MGARLDHPARREYVRVPWFSILELVMEIEELFDISIPDEDAANIHTVGELKRYIEARVPTAPTSECRSQRAFYRLRDAVARRLGCPVRRLRPSTTWEEILPRRRRKRTFAGIHRALGGILFETKAARADRQSAIWRHIATVLFVASALILWRLSDWLPVPERFFLISLALAAAGFFALRRRAGLPRRRRTLGEAAHVLVAREASTAAPADGRWTRERISAAVDRLVVEWCKVTDFTDRSCLCD